MYKTLRVRDKVGADIEIMVSECIILTFLETHFCFFLAESDAYIKEPHPPFIFVAARTSI